MLIHPKVEILPICAVRSSEKILPGMLGVPIFRSSGKLISGRDEEEDLTKVTSVAACSLKSLYSDRRVHRAAGCRVKRPCIASPAAQFPHCLFVDVKRF
ncbi:28S ribosomal protein S31 [Echinococcus multilocularis]|uniref:28S ribosomal protein S31 n=1 Tax=Echinococcus multilocularis TaxID=6211 RepID=A0A0S4MJF7_ECHMU|nr:28S ribosomal protein S31 [Echinococcus multilocularis]